MRVLGLYSRRLAFLACGILAGEEVGVIAPEQDVYDYYYVYEECIQALRQRPT
jgi:hypothetical protein